jgi:hypothetical protein
MVAEKQRHLSPLIGKSLKATRPFAIGAIGIADAAVTVRPQQIAAAANKRVIFLMSVPPYTRFNVRCRLEVSGEGC